MINQNTRRGTRVAVAISYRTSEGLNRGDIVEFIRINGRGNIEAHCPRLGETFEFSSEELREAQ